MKQVKTQLNKQQIEAVKHDSGPLLIVAGAGTGKTTVITEKIAFLINNKKLRADQILALTFTDKAAGEMEERVDKILPYGYTDLWVMTFHAFCERILKSHGLDIGIPNDFKLLNQTEQWMLVRENLNKFNLDYYQPLGNPTKFIHALISHFSRCKDEEIWPKNYLEYTEKLKINQDNMESTKGKDTTSEIKRLGEIANAYHIYQQLLLDNESLDFGDLINYTLKLFRQRPNILKKYQDQFKYVLVDEFQDTNWAQYELVKLLVQNNKNLTVVGDDDQCLPGDALVDMADGKKKRIDKIKKGEKVVSAVGKGHLGVCKVNKVFKNKKKTILFTIKTKSGVKIQVTDNHKMFCYVPKKSKGEYYYVYLMCRQDLGWRIGVTNDLAVRLKLERSADYILAIKAFKTEVEARYYETLWSLTYGIPTVCFKARDGLVVKGAWLNKLYQDIDVESGIKRFANDLNIDLNSYHYCLDAVTRGRSKRILIHFELNYRRHRSKDHVKKKKELMYDNLVRHQITIETSNKKIISKLENAGYKLNNTKKCKRLRITNIDIKVIGQEAFKLQKITGGFINYKFNLGKINYQTLPAIVIPAKNLVEGHYLPVRRGNEVYYDEIIDIIRAKVNQTVYDLEIDRTHNFIANGIIVHNSIYKFRGASVSNILQFKDDFSKSKEIYLNQNYRSSQNILDLAYNFIQLNNPERLEIKLQSKNKLSKKLESNTEENGIIEHLHFNSESEEVIGVVNKIIELYNQQKFQTDFPPASRAGSQGQEETSSKQGLKTFSKDGEKNSWNDFAILVRANSQAEVFLNGLYNANIPYNFVASKGLYSREVILDIIAYLKLLDNYHESLALWRILNLDLINIKIEDLMEITRFANQKTLSLYEVCQQINILNKINQETKRKIIKILNLISKHTKLAKEKNVKLIILNFLQDFNYQEYLLKINDDKAFVYINQLIKKTEDFEKSFDDKSVKNFIRLLDLELQSGEQGSLSKELEEGPEAVKVMTVHSAKGLEFKYVFIVNLVDKRFPSISRQDAIQLPDELVKEIIPSGDVHLQEERRLFYVAVTRAKNGLFFTSAKDYGGIRKKKLSRFIYETGMTSSKNQDTNTKQISITHNQNIINNNFKNTKINLPSAFSFSQLKAYETCPYQYYLSFILKVPVSGKAVFSYGKTMHCTLQKFFSLIKDNKQNSLFCPVGVPNKKNNKLPDLEKLLEIYQELWIDDWYESKEQKEKYKKQGRESLKNLYLQIKSNLPQVLELEKGFNFKISEYTIKGVIDRVDLCVGNKVELIDYKTGKPKTEKTIEKDQLFIYQIAAIEIFGWQVEKLTFYYLDGNKKVSFLGTDAEIEKQKEKILALIKQIKSVNFNATPSKFKCEYCDFNSICRFRQ